MVKSPVGLRFAQQLECLLMGVFALSMMTACSRGTQQVQEQENRNPQQLHIARSYGWAARTELPQPHWHPNENYVVVRTNNGLGILREGAGGEDYVVMRGEQKAWDPMWTDYSHVF